MVRSWTRDLRPARDSCRRYGMTKIAVSGGDQGATLFGV